MATSGGGRRGMRSTRRAALASPQGCLPCKAARAVAAPAGLCRPAAPLLLAGGPLLTVHAMLFLHAPQLRLLLLQAQLALVPRGIVVEDDEVAVLCARGRGSGARVAAALANAVAWQRTGLASSAAPPGESTKQQRHASSSSPGQRAAAAAAAAAVPACMRPPPAR